jgi:hypothetical protein
MPAGVLALTPLANTTLVSNTSAVTLSSISQGYRDLILVMQVTDASSSGFQLGVQFNGDTTSNAYPYQIMSTSGSSSSYAVSSAGSGRIILGWNGANGTNGSSMSRLEILDYSTTNKHKTSLLRNDDLPQLTTELSAYRWQNTSAITSIRIFGVSGNIRAGSTIALYGVSA